MPLYFIQLKAVQQTINSELPITHCLVGKRRDDFEKPEEELLKRASTLGRGLPPIPQEDLMRVHKYRYAYAHGKYTQKALAWAGSEEEAHRLKERFDPAEWDVGNFVLMPVSMVKYG